MNDKNKEIIINYTNSRNVARDRRVIPVKVWFGESKWHVGEGDQWFLTAFDTDKQAEREFAMLGINQIKSPQIAEQSLDPLVQSDERGSSSLKEAKLFTDGGSRGNPGPSAIGYVIFDMQDQEIEKRSKYLGITTNNQAEYQGLKEGLELCRKMHIRIVHVHMDSLLVVNQMKGIYKVKNRDLWPVYESVLELIKDFERVTFTHVPRELNKIADNMVNECLDTEIE